MSSFRVLTLAFSFVLAATLVADCVGWIGVLPPVRYPSSADKAVLVRDLDGDAAPEIIASGNHVDQLSAFSILPNRGDGTFAPERLLPSGFGEEIRAIEDLNRDGAPELLVSNFWANGIVVYLGRGALQFDGGTPYGTATHGGPSLIVDYDRDGKPDVLSLSFGSGNPVRLHLFPGRGDGTLGTKTTFETGLANGNWPSTRTINGALELLISEHSGHLGLLRYANGTVAVSTIAAGPATDLSSTFADVNGDGIADIIDTNDFDPSVENPNEPVFVTLGNADATFQTRKQLTASRKTELPVAVRAADVTGDGHADLLVCDFHSSNIYLFRGNGAGDFREGVPIDAGGPVNAFDLGDLNADGFPDVVTANDDHTVSVVINRGVCRPSRRHAVRH